MNATPQVVLTHDNKTVPSMTTKIITAFVNHPAEENTTVTVTSVGKIREAAILLISHSLSAINHRKIKVRVHNTLESLESIMKDTQFAELSVVTSGATQFIKPVDMAFLGMNMEGYQDLITYLNEMLKTNKPEQQNNTIWLLTQTSKN